MADDIVFYEELGEHVLIPRWSTAEEEVAAQQGVTDQERRDELFGHACNFMRNSLTMPGCFPPEEVDKAAHSATEFALAQGDRLAWVQLLEIFRKFVSHQTPPPLPLLNGLSEVFFTFKNGCSMDDAFGLNKGTRGRREEPYQQRVRERGNASAVAFWMDQLGTKSAAPAVKRWAEMQDTFPERADSFRTILRDYNKRKNSTWLAEWRATRRRLFKWKPPRTRLIK